MGQEDQFPPPGLSACYVIREKTFAGTHGNGRDAPKAAIRMNVFKPAELDPQAAFMLYRWPGNMYLVDRLQRLFPSTRPRLRSREVWPTWGHFAIGSPEDVLVR
jgi:hypothetical protein